MKKKFKTIFLRNRISLVILISLNTLVFGFSPKEQDPNKDKLLIEIISYVINRGHYDPREINDSFSENAFMNYLESLDGQHRFFLQSDIRTFESFRFKIDDEIKNAQINFFDLTFLRLKKRMKQVESFYSEILSKPFDFNIKEEISLDFKTIPYAKSVDELKAFWRKRFKLNALETFIGKKDEEIEKKKADNNYTMISDIELEENIREEIEENIKNLFEIYNDQKRKDWFSIYLNSIVLQFDPHTYYFAPRDKDRFDMSMSGKFEGIGARLSKRNQQIKVVEIISGGPVWRQENLQVGDAILKVRQENQIEAVDISGMVIDEAVKLIKGPKGTKVFLTIKRVEGNIEEISIVRDVVELEETYAKSTLIKDVSGDYGLIELPKFYINFENYNERNAAIDVKKELQQLKQRNVKGIILDLRNNGGGSLKTVVDMTGYFIDKGPVVQVKSTGGRKEVLKDVDPSIIWDGPLVVLVNEFSASASEIIAAALQDYKRAIVLGSKQTFGKGTVQNVIDLNKMITGGTYGDLGALKVTTDKFYRVNGKSTQLEGVKSDIVFPDRYAYVEMGEKDQDNPLAWDRITPANYKPSVMNNYDYAVEKSKKRLEENPIVSLIDEQALWVKSQQNDFSYFLDYDSFKTEMETKKKFAERFDKLSEFESPFEFKWLPEAGQKIPPNDTTIEKRKRGVESLKKDFYITEAVRILEDLSSIEPKRTIAKK
ncbi:MAG: carboxy terminal-processing peptidase [Bacteroidota bacterium]|nr:carboxy terminal-processing peptidase [Bacteroidota bacterium]